MKAVRVVGYHQNLELDEIAKPEVDGPHDVIVKIGGAGVCRTDIHILEGQWAEKSQVTLPYTIGHENAGWVDAVGSSVTNVAVGDKVIMHPLRTCGLCRACRFGDDVHCENSKFPGIDSDGGYAEYLKTSARSVVRIDDSLEPADVAALADAGLTAYHAVAKAARRLRAGDRAVLIGAGGLGHIGVQVHGRAVAGRDHRRRPQPRCAQAGRVDRRRPRRRRRRDDEVEQVLELTGGHGAEQVIDFVGEGGSTAKGLRMTRQGGDYHIVGYGENIDVPTIDLISTEINIIGNLVGSYNDLVELMALAAAQKVQLHTAKYALDDFQQALDDLGAGRVRGRAILVP